MRPNVVVGGAIQRPWRDDTAIIGVIIDQVIDVTGLQGFRECIVRSLKFDEDGVGP